MHNKPGKITILFFPVSHFLIDGLGEDHFIDDCISNVTSVGLAYLVD
jgi:hypothetical protein